MSHHKIKAKIQTISDRSPPGSARTAPSAEHQDGVLILDSPPTAFRGPSEIHGRDNITIGTWNTRTLRAARKLQELTQKMDRYK